MNLDRLVRALDETANPALLQACAMRVELEPDPLLADAQTRRELKTFSGPRLLDPRERVILQAASERRLVRVIDPSHSNGGTWRIEDSPSRPHFRTRLRLIERACLVLARDGGRELLLLTDRGRDELRTGKAPRPGSRP